MERIILHWVSTVVSIKIETALLLFFFCLMVGQNSFSDRLYDVQVGDVLGRIVVENYPSDSRINSKEQIMVAILRANPEAFQGGNIHFLKKVDSLVLPSKDAISLIPKPEATHTIQKHYDFFEQKKTGNFLRISLKLPDQGAIASTGATDVLTLEKKDTTKKPLTGSKDIDNISNKKISTLNEVSVDSNSGRTQSNQLARNGSSAADAIPLDKKGATKKDSRVSVDNKTDIRKTIDAPSNTSDSSKSTKSIKYGRNNKTVVKKAKKDSPISSKGIGFTKPVAEITEEVIVYNWPDYIPEGVLEGFTEETGIKVNYSTYSTNDVMYEKLKVLKGGGYDVLISSTYLVERMHDNGLIQPIALSKLENFEHLDPNLLDRPYDPENKFSIPYLWGSAGIGINSEKLKDKNISRWEDLWHEQWRDQLLLLDNMRLVFSIALKINGHSINSTNPDEIKLAYEKLARLKPNIKMMANNAHPELVSGKINLGVIWSADIVRAQKELPAFQYVYPEEGSNFWIESFVIPAMATHVDNAHAFIDYMLRPEVAVRCVEELGEATPNLEAIKLLGKEIRDNPAIFPESKVLKKAEFQKDIGKAMKLYLLYWDKLKVGD